MDKDIEINVETEGLEDLEGQLEAIADVYDGFPAQVTIKNCKNCTFNIYPSQTRFVEAEKGER